MPLDADMIDEVSKALSEFKTSHTKRIDELEKRMNRPRTGGGDDGDDTDAAKSAEVNGAFRRFLRDGDTRPLVEAKAMSVGSDPDGGYSVFPQVGPAIMRRMRELSPMRQVARVITLESGDAYEEIYERGDADAQWVGETAARTETDAPTLAMIRIPLCELTAMPKVTQKLLDTSAFDIQGWLSDVLANRFSRAEAAAFYVGDGVARPRGLTTYPTAATADATRALGVLEHVATGTSGDFNSTNPADVFFDVISRLGSGYRPNAKWKMNRRTLARIRKFKETTGGYIWQPGLQQGQPDSLAGYPVVECEDMPDIAANSLSIAFGDFRRGYTVVDRLGMRLVPDPYTSKPNVLLFGYKRVGGGVADFEAVKFIKFA